MSVKRITFFVLCLIAVPAFAAEPDPALLFPPETLAFVEIRDLSLLVEGWAGVVKGTPLEGSLNLTSDRRDRPTDINSAGAISVIDRIALLTAPELRAEIKRFHGAAWGMTGFDDAGRPQFAAVVLTGESFAAGLLARTYLTASPEFRRVKTVGDVPIYQQRPPPSPNISPEGKPLPFALEAIPADETSFAFAYTPGLIVVGSGPKQVEGVLTRFAGKESKSFATSPRLFEQSDLRKSSAVFASSDPHGLFASWESQLKKAGDDADSDLVSWLRFVVNPAAMKSLTLGGNLTADGWTIRSRIELDPAAPSPLFDLLDVGTANEATAHGVTLRMPARANRTKALLAAADAVAKAVGVAGRLPSDIVKRAEKDSGANWQMELLPSIETISLDLGPRTDRDAEPAIAIQSVGPAAKWAAAWPGLVRAADPDGKPATAAVEAVNGVAVSSFAVRSGPWPTVHLAVVGNRISLAPTRAAAVRGVKSAGPSDSDKGSIAGRFAPEYPLPREPKKPYVVTPPFAPPSMFADVLGHFPLVRFTADRESPNVATIQIRHTSWSDGSGKRAVREFANWLESVPARRVLIPERIDGGIMK